MRSTDAHPSLLPRQAVEVRFYPKIDEIQRELARAAVERGEPLSSVPRWTIQLLTFFVACRQSGQVSLTGSPASTGGHGSLADEAGFFELARRSADHGSRIFTDRDLWPVDARALVACARAVEGYSLGDLLVLLGRASDYGRTVEWEVGEKAGELVKKRDLVNAKSQGVFYTPTFIARHLARCCLPGPQEEPSIDAREDARPRRPPTVCDLAVGGGVLLLAAAEVLLERFEPVQVLGSLYGVDTDPLAVEVASIAVAAVCRLWRPGEPPPTLNTRIVNGDAYGGPVKVPATIDPNTQGGHSAGQTTDLAGPGAIRWAEAFPEAFGEDRPGARRGFDVVLTNPPFGRYKVDSDWLMAKEMRLDPRSLDAMRLAGRRRSLDLRSSGFYSLSMNGVLDKSRIGLERAMQITKTGGTLGAIIPSTINADTLSSALREHLLRGWEVLEINEFPEAARLFFEVNQSISVLAARKGGDTRSVSVRSGVRGEGDLLAPFSAHWSVDVLEKLSSKLAIPVRSGDAEDILERMHDHPMIGSLQHGGPFGRVVNARGEVDLSVFKSFLTDDSSMTPLVRGEQVDCYRADLPTGKETFVETDRMMDRLSGSPKLEHFRWPRLVGRQCSYLYRPQRLSFAPVGPEKAIANSLNYLVVEDEETRLYLLAVLNSHILNWRFKLISSNNHVANSEIDEFPVPDPNDVPSSLFGSIVEYAERLCAEADDSGVKDTLEEFVFDAYGLDSRQRTRIMRDEGRDARRERVRATP